MLLPILGQPSQHDLFFRIMDGSNNLYSFWSQDGSSSQDAASQVTAA